MKEELLQKLKALGIVEADDETMISHLLWKLEEANGKYDSLKSRMKRVLEDEGNPMKKKREAEDKKTEAMTADEKKLWEDKVAPWIKKSAPKLFLLKNPLTGPQFMKLLTEYGKDSVFAVFKETNNYKPFMSKYEDAYLTCDKWLKNRKPEAGQTHSDGEEAKKLKNAFN